MIAELENIDGNIAALTKYMNDDEATDVAWNHLLKVMDSNLKEIHRLIEECKVGVKESGYEFEKDLMEEICTSSF